MIGRSDAEEKVLAALVEAWNGFLDLPRLHSDELPDFRRGIHDLQRIIMVRSVLRAEKEGE
jgi:hypothetical protein